MVYSQYLFDSGTTNNPNSPEFFTPRNPFVARFRIFSAVIPLTFYTTGKQNNTLAIVENGVKRSVTIPPGNYNSSSFPAQLKNALGGSYLVFFDENQRNIRIENPNVTFSILGLDKGTTMFNQIGMSRTGESQAGNSYQGGVSNFTGTTSLLLVSSELSSPDIVVAGNEAINALALIELTEQPQSYMRWENPGTGFVEMNRTMNSVRFRFLDSRTLQEVDFRGQGFTIQVGILTDSDDPVSY